MATSTYGDADLVEVHLLRRFRDQCLLPSAGGRSAVWVYYRVGPVLASIVDKSPVLQRTARRVLDRVVAGIERHTSINRTAVREQLLRASGNSGTRKRD